MRIAHLSDLHLGLAPRTFAASERLCAELLDSDVDHVVVTGDVTHRGLHAELELFHRAFEPLLESGRVTVLPGNHDRLNDNAGQLLMEDARVRSVSRDGLHLVCVDSTGPHNRSVFRGHGQLALSDLDAIDGSLDAAPHGALTVVALHHHPLPLPEEQFSEHISAFFGFPFASELSSGMPLLERLRGRCDLVLHGHRHVPATHVVAHPTRPLRIFNAGSSTELGAFRIFQHRPPAPLTIHAPRPISIQLGA